MIKTNDGQVQTKQKGQTMKTNDGLEVSECTDGFKICHNFIVL
jgi:hypothetical protein